MVYKYLLIYLGNKKFKIIIAIIVLLSLIIIAGLIWFIFRLKIDATKTKAKNDDLNLEISVLKGNNQKLSTSYLDLLSNTTQLQADNTELIVKNRELLVNMTELQTKYDLQEHILDNYKRNMYDLY